MGSFGSHNKYRKENRYHNDTLHRGDSSSSCGKHSLWCYVRLAPGHNLHNLRLDWFDERWQVLGRGIAGGASTKIPMRFVGGCLSEVVGSSKPGQKTAIVDRARSHGTSLDSSYYSKSSLLHLRPPFIIFSINRVRLCEQNPALDMSDEDHNEISGEFGDHSITVAPHFDISAPPLPPEEEAQRPLIDYFKLFKPHHMKALIWKNFLWMWRNVGVMVFVIGLPCLQIILFCLSIGHDPTGLGVAVSNHELNGTIGIDDPCPLTEGCNYTLMSCRYLNVLKRKNVVLVSQCWMVPPLQMKLI